MTTKLRSVRKSSEKLAVSQPQKPARPQSRGHLPASAAHSLVLFQESEGSSEEIVDLTKAEYLALKQAAAPAGSGILMFIAKAALALIDHSSRKAHHTKAISGGASGLCLYDMEVGEVVVKTPLVERELHGVSVLVAALRLGITIDQFIADAIKEKLAACQSGERKVGT
jgi:hypothetical protein